MLSVLNNNPGNLRPVGSNTGFQSFPSPQEGLDALRKDLLLKIAGNSPVMRSQYGNNYAPTLANLINTWAPPTENNTQAYLQNVAAKTGIAPNQVLQPADTEALIPAITEQEGGKQALNHFSQGGDELIDVEMPDGTVIEGVPANISKQELLQKYNNFAGTHEKQEVKSEQKPTFLEDVGQNVQNAIQSGKDLLSGNWEDIGSTRITPKTQALADKLFPAGSEGSLFDLAKNAVTNTNFSDWSGATLEKFGNTPEGKILSVIGGVLPHYNVAGTAINRYVNPAISEATGIHPDNLSLLELASSPLGLKQAAKINDPSVAVAKGALDKLSSGVGNVAKGINARTGEDLADIASGKKSAAGATRQQMKDLGAVLSPQKGQELVGNLETALKDVDLIPELSPKTTAIVKRIRENSGSLELNKLDQYRRLLRSARDEDSVAASAVRTAIDKTVNGLQDQKDFAKGGTKAVNLLNDFRKEYTQASKFDDVAEIIQKAEGDPNKIRAGLNKFYKNKDNLRGWTDAEKNALKSAAKDGLTEKALKGLGSFGFDSSHIYTPALGSGLVALSAGNPAGIGVAALGTLARQARKYAARGEAENLLRVLEGTAKAKSGTFKASALKSLPATAVGGAITQEPLRITITPKDKR